MADDPDTQQSGGPPAAENIEIPPIPKETAGAVAGAAIGSMVGPAGAIIGGVVGAPQLAGDFLVPVRNRHPRDQLEAGDVGRGRASEQHEQRGYEDR